MYRLGGIRFLNLWRRSAISISGNGAKEKPLNSYGKMDEQMNKIQAATVIQKVFRGKQVRNNPQLKALKRQSGECPITQNRITMHNSTVTECGHAFEKTALMQWLKVSPKANCPTCRADIAGGGHNHNPPPSTSSTK